MLPRVVVKRPVCSSMIGGRGLLLLTRVGVVCSLRACRLFGVGCVLDGHSGGNGGGSG